MGRIRLACIFPTEADAATKTDPSHGREVGAASPQDAFSAMRSTRSKRRAWNGSGARPQVGGAHPTDIKVRPEVSPPAPHDPDRSPAETARDTRLDSGRA